MAPNKKSTHKYNTRFSKDSSKGKELQYKNNASSDDDDELISDEEEV